jgi:hypothetical protein
MGTKRFENVFDNMLQSGSVNGVNGSPFTLRDPDRVYYEDFFEHVPNIEESQIPSGSYVNSNFIIEGTNATNDDVTYATTTAGLLLTPDGSNGDQIIISPDTRVTGSARAHSAWGGTKWGTENQVQWECAIRTDAADDDDQTVWAGLKLTNTSVVGTDDDQAYFIYSPEGDDALTTAFTTTGNWHFVVSIGGTEYLTDLGVPFKTAKDYRFGINIDHERKVSAYVNGAQYSLTSTSSSLGTATGAGAVKSKALTNDVDLLPFVGIMNQAGTARDMVLYYEKISRMFFE